MSSDHFPDEYIPGSPAHQGPVNEVVRDQEPGDDSYPVVLGVQHSDDESIIAAVAWLITVSSVEGAIEGMYQHMLDTLFDEDTVKHIITEMESEDSDMDPSQVVTQHDAVCLDVTPDSANPEVRAHIYLAGISNLEDLNWVMGFLNDVQHAIPFASALIEVAGEINETDPDFLSAAAYMLYHRVMISTSADETLEMLHEIIADIPNEVPRACEKFGSLTDEEIAMVSFVDKPEEEDEEDLNWD